MQPDSIKQKGAPLEVRHTIIGFYEVRMSNPNGSAGGAGQPNRNEMTGLGLETATALKRKIRKAVVLMNPDDARYNRMYIDPGVGPVSMGNSKVDATASEGEARSFAERISEMFFDVRAFGAVFDDMDAPIYGPVQVMHANSVDPIEIEEIAISRQALTKESDTKADKQGMLGRRYVVPYGLYKLAIQVSPHEAEKTGFTEDDLEVLIQAVARMFEYDKADAREGVIMRRLVDFEHGSRNGEAPLSKISNALKATPNRAIRNGQQVPRRYTDYRVVLDTSELPDTIKVREII